MLRSVLRILREVFRESNERGILLILIVGICLPIVGFEFGRMTQKNSFNNFTTLKLYKNFTLKANNLIEGSEIISKERAVNLEKITLAEADQLTQKVYPDEEVYFIHRITKNPLDIQKIGTITTDKIVDNTSNILEKILKIPEKTIELLNILSDFSSIDKVHAHTPTTFEWHGYENNYNYYEVYIQEYLVERRYYDGAILRYKMSRSNRSIPSTFIWIKIPNHSH